jgi:uncharacterized membrane protein YdjX (TVP38/TMEM64 family)
VVQIYQETHGVTTITSSASNALSRADTGKRGCDGEKSHEYICVALVKKEGSARGYFQILRSSWKKYWQEEELVSWFKHHLCMVVLLAASFFSIFGLLRITEPYPLRNWDLLRDLLNGPGLEAQLVYLLLMAVVPLFAPLSILIITGAASFGPVHGMLLSYLGSLLNANLTFFLVKTLSVEHMWGRTKNTARIKEAISRRGFHLVLLLQMLSIIPFVAINSAAAASGVSWKDFFGATLLGVIPAVVLNSFVGETVVARLFPPDFYFSFILVVFLALIITAIRNRDIHFKKSSGAS